MCAMKKKKNCVSCGKQDLSKNEIGINQKLLGMDIRQFFCLSCLADYLEVSEEAILDKIEEFRAEGCKLFQ